MRRSDPEPDMSTIVGVLSDELRGDVNQLLDRPAYITTAVRAEVLKRLASHVLDRGADEMMPRDRIEYATGFAQLIYEWAEHVAQTLPEGGR